MVGKTKSFGPWHFLAGIHFYYGDIEPKFSVQSIQSLAKLFQFNNVIQFNATTPADIGGLIFEMKIAEI